MKSFIITIDTEGDNLWAYHKGDPIKTENVKFIPRFQDLCNRLMNTLIISKSHLQKVNVK